MTFTNRQIHKYSILYDVFFRGCLPQHLTITAKQHIRWSFYRLVSVYLRALSSSK